MAPLSKWEKPMVQQCKQDAINDAWQARFKVIVQQQQRQMHSVSAGACGAGCSFVVLVNTVGRVCVV